MRYKCLLVDHDDTTVDSTPLVHYPAHVRQMEALGREAETLSLDDWFLVNYEPGIQSWIKDVLRLDDDGQELCYRIWREYTTRIIPRFFDGILALYSRFREAGGLVVVVSHSEADIIARHYQSQTLLPGFMPDRIVGWEGDPQRHKPNPWPVHDVCREYGLQIEDCLVIDDLKPGIDMALKAGCDVVAALWSHDIPAIRQGLGSLARYTAGSIGDLSSILFSD